MNNTVRYLIGLMLFISLISCNYYLSTSRPDPEIPSGPRTIILNDKAVSENDVGGFISWYCQDYSEDGPILLEVGFFGDPKLKKFGFILFDGGNSGEKTHYMRAGLNHRWDWGPNGAEYAFVIQPDGKGLYYDFTAVSKGESTTASSVYKCHQR